MSFDPRDYDGVTYESERRERDEERELLAQQAEEEREREMAEPVALALSGWRRAISIADRRAA